MGWKSGDDCALGTMHIDWATRKLRMEGIDGHGPEMAPEEILAFLGTQGDSADTERWAMVYWYESRQFCLYSREQFVEEVWDGSLDADNSAASDAPLIIELARPSGS